MEKDLILLSEYCENSSVEVDFIISLEDEGLIETKTENEQKYIQVSQLNNLEMFSRLHYDLSVNVAGIDVINNLLNRIRTLEQEMLFLRNEYNADTFFEEDFFEEYL